MSIHAPELDGALAWLNTDRPLSMAELRGHLVVLDFWTYCCINCMHVIPTLRAIEEALAGEPLVVIGVHSAKFREEADPARVAEAAARYEIAHPICVDDEMRIWSRYAIRSWPTLVVVRPDGTIAAVAPGEPDRATLEAFLRRQLDEARAAGTLTKAPLRLRPVPAEDTGVLRFPGKVSVGPDGRVAIADSGHHRVLVCDESGAVMACAGSGLRGFVDGAFEEAAFDDPQGLAWKDGRVLVADARNHALREIDLTTRQVTTLAGTGALGVGRPPEGQAPARKVALRSPWDLAVSGDDVYVAMAGAHQIWRYDARKATIGPYAGTSAEALVDGPVAEAAFAQPSGLWLDRARRRLYVADSETSSVRAVDLARGRVETLVGVGLFDFGDVDGDFASARLQHDLGVCGAGGLVYVADTYNGKLKVLDEARREVRTVAAELLEPGGLAFAPDARLYVADTNRHRLLRYDAERFAPEPFTLRGAPEPARGVAQAPARQAARAQAGVSGWFTAQLSLPDGAALGPGEARLTLTLCAAPGTELAGGAPLRLALEVSRRPDLLLLAPSLQLVAQGGARERVVLPATVRPPGRVIESELVATIDYVACEKGDRAVCTPGRAHVRIPVRLAEDGGAQLAFDVPLG